MREQIQDKNMNVTENNSKPVQINNGNFDSEVLNAKQPVLVAFLTAWSRACAVISPVLDEIASECVSKLKVVRVNADANLDLSVWYDVHSIPTLLYFVSGNVCAKIIGTASKEAILSKLELISKES
jgi:thioredoxin 1